MNRSEAGLLGSKKAKEIIRKMKVERIEKYNINPKLCSKCRKPLPYEKRNNKYCSHSCSAQNNNLGVCRTGRKPMQVCLHCGNKFKSNAEYFCSRECGNQYTWEQWCKKTETLGYFEGYTENRSGTNVLRAKRYLLQKQNGGCNICGISTWREKPVPFVLDHKDGNPANWNIENTQVICRNCDGQLDTYCGKNIKKGRRIL